MIFRHKKWGNSAWCDRHIHAATLSDAALVEAATKVHPDSTALIDLLGEGARRRLVALIPIARQHLAHPDPFVATAAVGVLEQLGDASEVETLRACVPKALDHFHLAAILDAILTLDPAQAEHVLELAAMAHADESFDDRYVMAAVMERLARTLPDDSPGLERRLLAWAVDARLSREQRATIYRRLGALPRTPPIEDFLVAFCIHDDGADLDLTQIVDEALRRPA